MEYVTAKTIITRTKSRSWFGIDYNMNIYRGCCHGCIYCDSRSECYQITNFDTVRAKENALDLIRNELKKKRKTGVVGTGAMSDPYNPFEKQLELTRNALRLLHTYEFGIAIATKSPLVARDLDVLRAIQAHSPVIVNLTITTASDALCKKIEPNVAPTSKRFAAIKQLADAGIPCGILLMPILPFVNDTVDNILEITELAHENGVRFIYPAFGVTLRANQRDYYYEKLDTHFPKIKEKYIQHFNQQYICSIPQAKKLQATFTAVCQKYHILYQMPEIIQAYQQGYGEKQLSFFK